MNEADTSGFAPSRRITHRKQIITVRLLATINKDLPTDNNILIAKFYIRVTEM